MKVVQLHKIKKGKRIERWLFPANINISISQNIRIKHLNVFFIPPSLHSDPVRSLDLCRNLTRVTFILAPRFLHRLVAAEAYIIFRELFWGCEHVNSLFLFVTNSFTSQDPSVELELTDQVGTWFCLMCRMFQRRDVNYEKEQMSAFTVTCNTVWWHASTHTHTHTHTHAHHLQ